MKEMAPRETTRKPAPAETYTSFTCTLKSVGAPSFCANRGGDTRAAPSTCARAHALRMGRRIRSARHSHARSAYRWVVAQGVLRLRHANGQHAQRRIGFVSRDSALGPIGVGRTAPTVCSLDDRLDLALDSFALRVVQEAEVARRIGAPARRHDRLAKLGGALTSVRVVARLDCVESSAFLCELRDESNLGVRVRVEPIDRHDDAHCEPAVEREQWGGCERAIK